MVHLPILIYTILLRYLSKRLCPLLPTPPISLFPLFIATYLPCHTSNPSPKQTSRSASPCLRFHELAEHAFPICNLLVLTSESQYSLTTTTTIRKREDQKTGILNQVRTKTISPKPIIYPAPYCSQLSFPLQHPIFEIVRRHIPALFSSAVRRGCCSAVCTTHDTLRSLFIRASLRPISPSARRSACITLSLFVGSLGTLSDCQLVAL